MSVIYNKHRKAVLRPRSSPQWRENLHPTLTLTAKSIWAIIMYQIIESGQILTLWGQMYRQTLAIHLSP